jgi:hypothetical protein
LQHQHQHQQQQQQQQQEQEHNHHHQQQDGASFEQHALRLELTDRVVEVFSRLKWLSAGARARRQAVFWGGAAAASVLLPAPLLRQPAAC